MAHEETFVSRLSSWSRALSLTPDLSKITLANMLASDTCEPISLRDFEAYLRYREHSLENLHFIAWYQSYRHRYEQVVARSARLSLATTQEPSSPISVPEPVVTTPISPCFDRTSTCHLLSSWRSSSPPPPPSTTPPLSLEDMRSLKEECMAAIATFLQPDGPKALSIDDSLRNETVRKLATSVHYQNFTPVYDETYYLLETSSLKRFLAFATSNINLPTQILWYGVGAASVLLGLGISLGLVLNGRTPHRAWRLLGVPFVTLGTTSTYSAWRGFCSQVWRRNGVQLHPWQLASVDEETTFRGSSVTVAALVTTIPDAVGSSRHSMADIAPFYPTSDAFAGPSVPTSRWNRPPLFGPERIVVDERIKQVHRNMVRELVICGICSGLVFSAVIFSVPSR